MTTPTQQQQRPARISDRDPYIRAEYLPATGAAVTIHAWIEEQVRQPNNTVRTMPVLVFTNGKRMIINVTNLRKLATLFHNDEAASIGQSIIIKPSTYNNKPTILVDRLARSTTQEGATGK